MKKIFMLAFGLVSLVSTAQKTIVEEKFEKDNVPLSYTISNNNDLLLQKGGRKQKDKKNNFIFTNKGDKSINPISNDLMYLIYKKRSDFCPKSNHEPSLFNESFFYINEKDNSYYEVTNIIKATNTFELDLDKPVMFIKKGNSELESFNLYLELPKKNKNLNTYSKKNLAKVFYRSDFFEIISKEIDKSCNKVTINRFIFSYEGKFIKELNYSIEIQNSFISSVNQGGYLANTFVGNVNIQSFSDYLSINNLFIDENTEDVYFYGLFGVFGKKNIKSNPQGYYIFKFDKNSNKIWSKIENIKYSKLNSFGNEGNLYSNLCVVNNKINFIIFSDKYDEFILDKNIDLNGNIFSESIIEFKEEKVFYGTESKYFLLNFYKLKELKNRIFDICGLVYFNKNKQIKDYIISLNNPNKVFFNVYPTNKGIWLIESDNDTYYKVTYFDHE